MLTKPIVCSIFKMISAIAIYFFIPIQAYSEQFSIVVLPDTQYYSETAARAAVFRAQTQWIVNNRSAENIIYVPQLGDLRNGGNCADNGQEWTRARNAMNTMHNANVAYSIAAGNHDGDDPVGSSSANTTPCLHRRTQYNSLFGRSRFTGPGGLYNSISNADYGTFDTNSNDNNYALFQSPSGDVKFISINLAWRFEGGPVNGYPEPNQNAVLDWADGLLKQYADRKALVTAHYLINDAGNRCPDSDFGGPTSPNDFENSLVNRLQQNPNLFLILSAHCRGEKWVIINQNSVDRTCMGRIDGLMSNYQDYEYTGPPAGDRDTGYLRIMRFDTVAGTVEVETYSPWIAGQGDAQGTTHDPATPATMNTGTVSNFSFPFNPKILAPSISLLMDTSGSMSWDVNGVPGVPQDRQRIAFAKAAAMAFFDLMVQSNHSSSTNFSIDTFPAHPSNNCNAQNITPLAPSTQTAINTAITNTIPNLTTENGTPLLNGLALAAQQVQGQLCKSILVLSDGYHNCPNVVSTGDTQVSNVVSQLSSTNTRVYSVGFGQPNDTDNTLLQHVANETNGSLYDATHQDNITGTWTPSVGLTSRFKEILTNALNLQTAADPLGIIKGNETKTYHVHINENDHKISFFLSWETAKTGRLAMKIFDSSNQPLAPADIKTASGETYIITTITKAVLNQPGRVNTTPWRVEISLSRPPQIGLMAVSASEPTTVVSEPYQYSAIVDSDLKMQASLDKQKHAAGDTITLTAKLTEGRRLMTGLSSVEVTISRPDDGKGNWLATNEVSNRELDKIPEIKGSEKLAPFMRKGIYLTDIAGIKFPGRRGPQTIRLFDDGSHGDESANDGIYTHRFSDTGKEGIYSFLFKAKGPTHFGNGFNREVLIQKYLPVRSIPEAIAVNMARLTGSGGSKGKQFLVTATPKDGLGNYLGPGHASQIRFTATKGSWMGALKDNLDGSYSQILSIAATVHESDVDVTVKVDEANKEVNLGRTLGGYAWSVHAGRTNPLGNFNNRYDADYNLSLDISKPWFGRYSWVGTWQYSRFKSAQAGLADTHWWSLNGDLKYESNPINGFEPFVNGGLGIYVPKSGSTEPGIHFGVGVQKPITAQWSWELAADYHKIFTSDPAVRFSVIRAGLIWNMGGN